jgi:UDP-2-acetamido-3-amino-2,3-dideoxy-glucuronate N-acetyltransferase
MMVKQINIGIIGIGRFGKNYLRTFDELENAKVTWICATKESTLNEALSQVKTGNTIKSTTNYKEILEDKEVDAVAITTPGTTHHEIAKAALMADKHVIAEKPLCLNSKDVEELINISKEKNKALMVSHLHVFNPAIMKLKEDIKSGLFGKIDYIQIFHTGNGPVRADMGAVWDFFPHSASILLYLLEENPIEVSANGASFIKKDIEDITIMNLKFPERKFATSLGSWLHPLKKMEITVVGENMYASFDDYATEEKLRYYNSRPKVIEGKIVIEDKGYTVPEIKDAKPLTQQLKHFLDCIENDTKPLTDGMEALKVIKILESAQESINEKKTIKL